MRQKFRIPFFFKKGKNLPCLMFIVFLCVGGEFEPGRDSIQLSKDILVVKIGRKPAPCDQESNF